MKQSYNTFLMQSLQRKRRFTTVMLAATSLILYTAAEAVHARRVEYTTSPITKEITGTFAEKALTDLAVKGREPKTGYSRTKFSNGWGLVEGCDVRNWILARDLDNVVKVSDTDCTVVSGFIKNDPYTSKPIIFSKGQETSGAIQIDHVVAVSDAWQKGAQLLSEQQRQSFYNDPLNLLAVDGSANTAKGDADAASWLPPNKLYRCKYIARQIAVKIKYHLWVTHAERDVMKSILRSCPDQLLPKVATS